MNLLGIDILKKKLKYGPLKMKGINAGQNPLYSLSS